MRALEWMDALPAAPIAGAGGRLMRYALAGFIVWFGAFKFTAAEATAIEPLLRHSPLLGWLYGVTDVRGASRWIGALELAIAALVLARPLAPRLAALGGLLAAGMFVTTLSFLVTTPGSWAIVDGVPVPASAASGFIVKDVFLLAAALWTAGEALGAARTRRPA